jgi:hypothetical protein
VTRREPADILRRNLESLDTHRPHVGAMLRAHASDGGGYRLIDAPDGRRVVTHDEASRVPGGPGAEQALREALAKPAPAAIAGVGDGRVLGLVASRAVGAQGSTSAVYLCEPDLDRLQAALSTADLTGPAGPIEHPAVRWFVGERWGVTYRDTLAPEPLLPLPDIHARLGVGDAAERVWQETVTARAVAGRAALEAARAWSASEEVTNASAWLDQTEHRPRVLLITSRFTTVVRSSVDAAARGFAALGWETHTCIERADHERLTPEAVVRSIAAFRPDLIVAVNYHRHHFVGVPDGVPFVCWIQDDMLHLIEPGAGALLGERDFVMGAWAHRYAKEWGYQADRCIVVPRMTDVRGSIASAVAGAEPEMLYVSSHSGVPREILARLAAGVGTATAQGRAAVRAGESLIALYESGGSVADQRVLRRMLIDAARDEGIETPDTAWVARVSELLSLHLNNPLYRQQGLQWAAGVAESRGLRLSVYGPGWERHPTVGPHARGVIAYGEALESATRSAAFNLRLEPYPAMCHQRLIDAVAAGGFVLSRRFSPGEEPEAHYAAFFLERLAGRASSDRDVSELLDDDVRLEWRRLTDGLCAVFPQMRSMDVTAHFTKRLREGTMADYIHSAHPPRFFETVFDDESGLGDLVAHFTANPAERAAIAQAQRASIIARFSYQTGLRIMLKAVSVAVGVDQAQQVGGEV